jgi:hypothetical protein
MKVEVETPKDKIKMIMDRLGMTATIAAKAMEMPDSTFRKKIMPSSPLLTFTEKNYTDLLDFIIDEYQFLFDSRQPKSDHKPKIDVDVPLLIDSEATDVLVDANKAFIDINYTFNAIANEDKSNSWKMDELRKILNQLQKTQFEIGVKAGFKKSIKLLESQDINQL